MTKAMPRARANIRHGVTDLIGLHCDCVGHCVPHVLGRCPVAFGCEREGCFAQVKLKGKP